MTAFFLRKTLVVAPDKPKMYNLRRQAFAFRVRHNCKRVLAAVLTPVSMGFIMFMLKPAVYQPPTLYMFLVIGFSM